MERRLHTRHRARTTVYIMLPAGKRRLCRAVNLSANGVFIRTASLGLKKGQQVAVEIAQHDKRPSRGDLLLHP